MISVERLREILHYDPATGIFTHRVSRNGVRVGTQAGTLDPRGMRVLSINSKYVAAKRIAFLYMTGEMPAEDVLCLNGNLDDIRFSNLQLLTRSQTTAHQVLLSRANRSGFRGVSWHKASGRWRASIGIGKKSVYLGLFSDPIDGARAYDAAADKYFGEFARLNFPGEVRAA